MRVIRGRKLALTIHQQASCSSQGNLNLLGKGSIPLLSCLPFFQLQTTLLPISGGGGKKQAMRTDTNENNYKDLCLPHTSPRLYLLRPSLYSYGHSHLSAVLPCSWHLRTTESVFTQTVL